MCPRAKRGSRAKVLPDRPKTGLPTDTGRCSIALQNRIDDIGVGATPLQVSHCFMKTRKNLPEFAATYQLNRH
jgi:hypothetical protein